MGPSSSDSETASASGAVGGIPYRWVAMGVVLFGTFLVALDTTVVNLGLPSMQDDFGTVEGVEWVVTAYLAAVGVTQMCTGWASDRFGRKASFVFALALFTLSSVLCALAPSLEALVAARVLQGVGGGLLMPVGMAMVYELFEPAERGKALGYFGIAVMVAPAIGPPLGGGLVAAAGWRWIFVINIPIGLVGIPVALRLLRDVGYREVRRLDWVGLGLGGSGLAALIVGFSRAGSAGWGEPVVLALLVVAALLLGSFGRHALRSREPLVDLRIFAHPVFSLGMAVIALTTVAQYSRLVYIPLELGTLRDVSEFHIGLVMLPSALCIASMMPVGGRLVDRIGARVPVTIGVAVLGISFLGLAALTVTTPLWMVAAILGVGGLGAGLCLMTPNIQAMNAVPARLVSQATGLSTVSRQVSAAIGTAVMASLFATVRPDGSPSAIDPTEALGAYRTVFLAAAGILAVVVVVAQFLPGRETALALQEQRRAEMAELGLVEERAGAQAEVG